MEELQEKSLKRPAPDVESVLKSTAFEDLDADVRLALVCASEKKAFDLVALDLRDVATFTEFFIIASGGNQRQVQAIADEIEEKLKKDLKSRPVRTEGYTTAEWVLMDYGDFIVHIFEKNAREFYDLERLWRDAVRVTIPSDL